MGVEVGARGNPRTSDRKWVLPPQELCVLRQVIYFLQSLIFLTCKIRWYFADNKFGFDAEVEAPILWPPNAKSQLNGKDPDAEKDWKQKEKGAAEVEMVGWHHRLNGYEFVYIVISFEKVSFQSHHNAAEGWVFFSGSFEDFFLCLWFLALLLSWALVWFSV